MQPRLRELVDRLFERVPAGVGAEGFVRLSRDEFREVGGAGGPVVREATATAGRRISSAPRKAGCIAGADASKVSDRAVERGYKQIGTLGSGNHYLEIQVARPENVFDDGSWPEPSGSTCPNQVVVMFHCGSRGFGHQVATDYLRALPQGDGGASTASGSPTGSWPAPPSTRPRGRTTSPR